MSDREEAAFDAAIAAVTCFVIGDRDEARRIVFSNDTLHRDMLMILAETLAVGHSAETWQQAVLESRLQA